MNENLKKFLEYIGKNPELLEKAKQLKADDPDKANEIVIAFAKENGFELTESDFEAPDGELSENELSAVAGGGFCFCSVGGGGTEDGDDGVCACVGYGQGDVVDSPTGEAAKEFAGDVRCYCFMAGIGDKAEDLGESGQGSSFIR